MASTTKTDEQRREQFEEYNPYAKLLDPVDGQGFPQVTAMLAIAYELAQVRAAIRFGRGGGSK